MSTATVIALVLSSLSLAAAAAALFLSFREGTRREVEIGLLRDEAGRRDEELHLLRQQLDDERTERLQQQRAQLVPSRGTTRSDKQRVEYDVIVRNAGPYPAMRVTAQTEYSDHGPSQISSLVATLMPGESATLTFVGLRPAQEGAEQDPAPALLLQHEVVLEWWDGLGHHREPTGLRLII